MHVLLLQLRREEFDIAATTVNFLLVFDGELDDQRLALVAEVSETRRHGVETGVLARLQT